MCCLRGVSTLTGFGLAVEIGDWHRFTGCTIGAYLGLVPTESSSGAQRSQGSITKTGNTHARRLLVEAAWHHRKAYRPGLTMRARWDQAPAAARARGHEGNHRLHHRWEVFTGPEEAAGRRERRHRPGAGRLVLVAGRDGRLTVTSAHPSPGKVSGQVTLTETMTERTPTGPVPDRSPSRDDPGTTSCPVCLRCYTPDRPTAVLQHRLPQDRVPAPAPATRRRRSPSRPPGPAGRSPSTNAPTAGNDTWASNAARAAAPSPAGSASAANAHTVTGLWQFPTCSTRR